MEKTGLVLEGGGVRGAYTAGAVAWLIDHNIRFDASFGVSSGAVYQTCYELGNRHALRKMACEYACADDVVGLKALFSEGYYVAYKKLFREDLIEKEHFSVEPLKETKPDMSIACYDLDLGKTVYFKTEDLDDSLELLRATCSLPVAAPIVEFKGRKLLDGGITKMIPIEEAAEQGVTRSLIITTKPKDYVRKPASFFVKILMRLVYPKYPCVLEDYKVRHLNYYKQIGLINELEEKGQAMMIYPSKTIKVSRWKGDPEKCNELFELGWKDMEDRKEHIFRFLGLTTADLFVKEEAKEKVPA